MISRTGEESKKLICTAYVRLDLDASRLENVNDPFERLGRPGVIANRVAGRSLAFSAERDARDSAERS